LILRDRPRPMVGTDSATAALFLGLRRVATNLQSWLCAIFGMAMTAPMLSFAGLWAVPWLVQIHGLERPYAAALASVMFAGFGTGAPILGWLSDRWGYRRRVLFLGGAISILGLCAILYLDNLPLAAVLLLFYLHGFGAGSMIVGFAAVRELNPPTATGAAYGLVNTFVVGSGALFQPLIGWLLDRQWDGRTVAGARVYSAEAFSSALSVLVVMVAIGLIAVAFIRETRGKQVG
ncbi:MAG: MFS transporter, partial [Alphaproteobacteria bacterium]|nr:MFS transporter [Alphaproteobacteria bacterium]